MWQKANVMDLLQETIICSVNQWCLDAVSVHILCLHVMLTWKDLLLCEVKKEGERGGGVGYKEMTSVGDRREMKDVETDREKEGGT